MNKVIENFLVPLFLVVSVLYAFNSFGSDGMIQLNKVYHHTTDSPVHLEKANVSLYFSGDPQLQEIKNKNSQNCTATAFFFPKAVINKGDCQDMIKRLHNHLYGYTVTVEEVASPTRGIMITFTFDHNKFAISHERFDSIGLQKGVVFRLHNKELLKKLEKANNQPVLRTLWHTGKPCIAIDPGHGGIDSGAIGHDGIQEKQICLAIGTAVGTLLEQHGCSVLLTRKSDCGVALDERTACANNNHVDLFVSIHANYAVNSRAIGVETFCLQPHLLKRSFSQLSASHQDIVSDVMSTRAHFSCALAQSVQRHLCDVVSGFHDEVIDRKVKHSVTQVLLGAQMPAVLVEVGFVSHKKEAALLGDYQYQNRIAQGICDGILFAIRSQSSF